VTARRRRRPSPLALAAADVKRMRVQFERDASYVLSLALGFNVTVKIKPQKIAPPKNPPLLARRTKRQLADAFSRPLTPFQLEQAWDTPSIDETEER
jgi:hypothetical protein